MSFISKLFDSKEPEPSPREEFVDYFSKSVKPIVQFEYITLGELQLPTGEIIVCDPLVSLGMGYNKVRPFIRKVPSGSYPVTIAVVVDSEWGNRYAAARLQFSSKEIVRWELALRVGDDPKELKEPDDIFGFPVDAGLGCFCDKQTEEKYEVFINQWEKEHPGLNNYDDYFAKFFEESYRAKPLYQRNGGDWINWSVPNTDNNVIMFASGFGDGYYPSYWGLDKENTPVCLVIQFISPDEFSEDEDEC